MKRSDPYKRLRFGLVYGVVAILLALALAPFAPAQSAQVGAATRLAWGTWIEADVCEELQRLAVVRHSGQEVFLRVYAYDPGSLALLPVSGWVQVNELTAGQQDECTVIVFRSEITGEPEIAVAWSCRNTVCGTAYMNGQTRTFDLDGNPTGPEQSIPDVADGWIASWSPPASAWLPFLEPHPDGGYMASVTGGWLERVLVRRIGSGGFPLSPELAMSPPVSGDSCCGDLVFDQGGRMLSIWSEFTGGLVHLRGRIRPPGGAPGPVFDVAAGTGDQAFSSVSVDGGGRWAVAWRESGVGVRARRLGPQGGAIAPTVDVGPGGFPELRTLRGGRSIMVRGRGSPSSYNVALDLLDRRARPQAGGVDPANAAPLAFPPNVTEDPPNVALLRGGRAGWVFWGDVDGVYAAPLWLHAD